LTVAIGRREILWGLVVIAVGVGDLLFLVDSSKQTVVSGICLAVGIGMVLRGFVTERRGAV
jgi:hypothetical protein